jgi:hypothetical protein
LDAIRCRALAALAAAGLVLAACTGASLKPPDATAAGDASSSASFGQRDLTPPEKKVIVDAVAPSLRDAAAAKYRWAKISTTPASDGSINYCAIVDAKSPYPAYSGRQDYIVEVKLTGDRVSSAVMGLIAGGKDTQLVRKMCEKYGLDPNNAS